MRRSFRDAWVPARRFGRFYRFLKPLSAKSRAPRPALALVLESGPGAVGKGFSPARKPLGYAAELAFADLFGRLACAMAARRRVALARFILIPVHAFGAWHAIEMSTQRADLDFRPSVLKNIADGPALDGISREPARVRERMTAGGARMIRGRLEVAGPVITDYILRTSMNPSRIFLLLHGYGLAAEYVYRKLLPLLPEDAAVLAPNGPFPIPERRPDGFRLGFAWYFYDPAKDQYLIDYRVALAMLKGVLEQLGFSKLSKTLIGFSQGGYLAPFAANALGGVEQVIGVGCRFPEEDFDFKPTFRMDQVHGADDDRVDPKESRASHERLRVQGVKGSFAEIAGEGHRLSPGIVEQIGVFLAAQDSIHQSN